MKITRAKEVLEYHISSNVLPYGEKPLNSTTLIYYWRREEGSKKYGSEASLDF